MAAKVNRQSYDRESAIFIDGFDCSAPEKFAILHPSSIVKRHVPSSNNRIKHINDFAEGREPTIEYLAYQELARLDNGGLTVRYLGL